MYIVVFFLLLWTLFQVILTDDFCKFAEKSSRNHVSQIHRQWNHSIYLIEPKGSEKHKQLNEKFIDKIKIDYGLNDIEPLNIAIVKCNPHKVLDILNSSLIRNLSYVIYLGAIDFYRMNYNEVKNNGFIWAGDTNNPNSEPLEVCKSTDKMRVWKTKTVEECESSIVYTKAAKVVSEKVLENSFLMDFVNNFGEKNYVTYTHYVVLICSNPNDRDENKIQNAGINTIINYRYHCSIQNEAQAQVIAIIAPNSAGIEETSIPIIFFDQDTSQAEAGFPNAMYQAPRSYKNLAEEFFWLIREMGWSRVAIISDGSIESIQFEEHLISKFKTAASLLSYTTREVVETSHGYDFTQALAYLKHAEARIIIANVAEEHAVTLADTARKLMMSQQTVWVAREWSEQKVAEATKKITTVYSVVTVSQRALHASIDAIKRTIKYVYPKNDISENDILDHKHFAGNISHSLHWDPKIHIYLTNTRRHNELIAEGNVWQRKIEKPMDRFTDCTLKTLNFDRHCDDIVLIYVLLVIAVFAITVLGITYFFTSPPDTPYNRMRS